MDYNFLHKYGNFFLLYSKKIFVILQKIWFARRRNFLRDEKGIR